MELEALSAYVRASVFIKEHRLPFTVEATTDRRQALQGCVLLEAHYRDFGKDAYPDILAYGLEHQTEFNTEGSTSPALPPQDSVRPHPATANHCGSSRMSDGAFSQESGLRKRRPPWNSKEAF